MWWICFLTGLLGEWGAVFAYANFEKWFNAHLIVTVIMFAVPIIIFFIGMMIAFHEDEKDGVTWTVWIPIDFD